MRALTLLVPVVMLAAPAAARAQELDFLDHTTYYVTIGGGNGSYTFKCGDPACANKNTSSGDFRFAVGRHVNSRLRVEFTGHNQRNEDNSVITLAAGAGVYLLRGLHVRGGFATSAPHIDDASGSYSGNGKGFYAGGGYDLFLLRTFAISPYVNIASVNIPSVERTQLGGARTTSTGTLKSTNFGFALSWVGGLWQCTNRAGQRVTVTRKNRFRAQACLDEVAATMGRRR
jgi:hypothetical protein